MGDGTKEWPSAIYVMASKRLCPHSSIEQADRLASPTLTLHRLDVTECRECLSDITWETAVRTKFLRKEFDVSLSLVYLSSTFDENLLVHINCDLADDVGRASDAS